MNLEVKWRREIEISNEKLFVRGRSHRKVTAIFMEIFHGNICLPSVSFQPALAIPLAITTFSNSHASSSNKLDQEKSTCAVCSTSHLLHNRGKATGHRSCDSSSVLNSGLFQDILKV